jgi:hypothetical protein
MNKIIKVLLCICLQLLWWSPSFSRDYANLYDRGTLEAAYQIYQNNLRGIWEEDLKGRLSRDQRLAARDVSLNLPLIGYNRHPLDYYALPDRRSVTIPIISAKFFDDICVAMASMEKYRCNKLLASDYIGMIRYQNPGGMPGRRFPAPLNAMRIPANALEDNYVYDVSGKALKSGIYFLMAHELAHVLYQHRGYGTISALQAQRQETQADNFALNLMKRISVAPVGMSIFFMIASRFELAPGDFPSFSAYESYLRTSSTHPLTSQRLINIANYIQNNVDAFIRGQAHPNEWRQRMMRLADDIRKIGETLDDRGIRELQRARSLRVTLQDLSSACR